MMIILLGRSIIAPFLDEFFHGSSLKSSVKEKPRVLRRWNWIISLTEWNGCEADRPERKGAGIGQNLSKKSVC